MGQSPESRVEGDDGFGLRCQGEMVALTVVLMVVLECVCLAATEGNRGKLEAREASASVSGSGWPLDSCCNCFIYGIYGFQELLN